MTATQDVREQMGWGSSSTCLARDTALLVEGGFRLDAVQPVDLFPKPTMWRLSHY